MSNGMSMVRQAWVQIQDHGLASLSLSLLMHQMGSVAQTFSGFYQGWLRNGWCTVGAQPTSLPVLSDLGFPLSLRLHSWTTYYLLRDHLPPSLPQQLSPGDGSSPGMWVGSPGAALHPPPHCCWTEASVWSCWGPFTGPDP